MAAMVGKMNNSANDAVIHGKSRCCHPLNPKVAEIIPLTV
jgi:hypothetical protein